jgi:hypothetical protein
VATREVVINFLQYLAEDTFVFTNPVTIPRKEELRNAMIAIAGRAPMDLTAANVTLPTTPEVYAMCGIQPGHEGWLSRLFQVLAESIQGYSVCLFDRMFLTLMAVK